MKLIIKNSFLGKHVFDEDGKEICQIKTNEIDLTQKILLINQQKTYVSTLDRVYELDKQVPELKLQILEEASMNVAVFGKAVGESGMDKIGFHELDIEDMRQKKHIYLHLNTDTSWNIEDHLHERIGRIKKMDAYGDIQLECASISDSLLLCSFYIFTRYLMKENERIAV